MSKKALTPRWPEGGMFPRINCSYTVFPPLFSTFLKGMVSVCSGEIIFHVDCLKDEQNQTSFLYASLDGGWHESHIHSLFCGPNMSHLWILMYSVYYVCMCAHMHVCVCLCTWVYRRNYMFECRGPKLMLVSSSIAFQFFFWDRVFHWTTETLWSHVSITCLLLPVVLELQMLLPHPAALLWGCWSLTLGSLFLCRKIWAISPIDNIKFDIHL